MIYRWGLYMTYGKTPDGRNLAIISDGSPQLGHDPVTVLEVMPDISHTEAHAWFARMQIERPWEVRQ